MEIRRARESDWRALRECRLRALRDAPHAFASPLQRELAFDDEVWRRRARGSDHDVMVMAFVGGEAVGLAGAYVAEDAAEPELVSMWVDPRCRARGIARALVEAVAAWASEAGFASIYLRVTRRAPAARRVYERCGFVATGEATPFPLDANVLEDTMRLRLDPRVENAPT